MGWFSKKRSKSKSPKKESKKPPPEIQHQRLPPEQKQRVLKHNKARAHLQTTDDEMVSVARQPSKVDFRRPPPLTAVDLNSEGVETFSKCPLLSPKGGAFSPHPEPGDESKQVAREVLSLSGFKLSGGDEENQDPELPRQSQHQQQHQQQQQHEQHQRHTQETADLLVETIWYRSNNYPQPPSCLLCAFNLSQGLPIKVDCEREVLWKLNAADSSGKIDSNTHVRVKCHAAKRLNMGETVQIVDGRSGRYDWSEGRMKLV